MAGGPLAGVRILDMTAVVVGPLTTQMLADHGAEVIKVEPPGGDIGRFLAGKGHTAGMAGKFLALNRNKRSLVLDLKQPAAYEALTKLIATADVMLWNVRPPSMARLKLAYEDVRKINPRIIYLGMFGFGQDGRYREKPAYDTIIQGVSGVAGLHAKALGRPQYVPYVLADRTVGLIATQHILMALYHRERTGEGQSIEVPMFENMVTQVLTEHLYLHTFDPPLGPMGDPRILDPSNRPLETKDSYISISANTDAQAFALFEAIGRPELKDDPRFSSVPARFKNVREYYSIRAEGLKQKTTAEWIEIFDRLDVPAAPYNSLESLLDDPHLDDIGFFQTVEHPTEGKLKNLRLANKSTVGARTDFLPAPKLGQHTTEVLREAGYDDAAIERMLASGAARQWDGKS